MNTLRLAQRAPDRKAKAMQAKADGTYMTKGTKEGNTKQATTAKAQTKEPSTRIDL